MSSRSSKPRLRSATAALAAIVVAAAVWAPSATAGPLATACTGRPAPPATYRHVLVIVMENHSAGQIVGSPKTPYITKVARRCGWAARYLAITHPSLPNYLAMTSGSTSGITTDCNACRSRGPSIFEQLGAAGRSWRAYEESMPSPCLRADSGRYLMRHNPPAYFTRLRATCPASDVPIGTPARGALRHALRKNILPAYSFLTPDACHDMHDCPKSAGDAWLRSWLPMILANTSYQNGELVVFLTFDEGRGGFEGESCHLHPSDPSCHVATIVISPYVGAGAVSRTAFTHYSLLRTTENLLGLPLLGHARTAVGMRRAFGV
jgi:phosphatidylinositol-3-phosphatase